MKVGDKVKWSSQAGGVWKEKRGTLIALLAPEQDALKMLPSELPKSRFKGERFSENFRGMVEVPRGGKSSLSDFYAPRMSALVLNEEGLPK